MSPAEMPHLSLASSIARVNPSMNTRNSIPLAVWVWGSKKISARRTPSSLARLEVGEHQIVEVVFSHEDRRTLVVDVEEGLQILEVVGRPDLLHRSEGKVDAVRAPSSNIISGSSVPSMCRWSSAFGSARTNDARSITPFNQKCVGHGPSRCPYEPWSRWRSMGATDRENMMSDEIRERKAHRPEGASVWRQ